MNRLLLAIALAACSAGCAGARSLPELAEAKAAFTQAELSPAADRAQVELSEAQIALAEAERAQDLKPGSREARDKAYVALRMAEKAKREGVRALEVEALVEAREDAERLRRTVEYRTAAAEERARRTEAARKERIPLRRALQDGLVKARSTSGVLSETPEGLLLRLPVEELFIWGTSHLKYGADRKIARIAAAVRAGPPCSLRVQILDDLDGVNTSGALLAKRRLLRLREALIAEGIPGDFLVPSERSARIGTQVDFVITEKPVIVPPVTPPLARRAAGGAPSGG